MRPAAALSLSVLALSMLCGCASSQEPDRGYRVAVGDPVPEFNLTDLDGRTWSSEGLKGSVYILQFTASWCGVCRKEMPHLEERVWQRFKDDGLQLLSVDLDEPAAKIQGLVDDTGVTYPVCLDPGRALCRGDRPKGRRDPQRRRRPRGEHRVPDPVVRW